MTILASRDLAAILEFLLEVRTFTDLDQYRSGILPGLRRLVPADSAGYTEVDPHTLAVKFVGEPADAFFDGVEQRFAELVSQHPLVARGAAGDRSTHTISEFLTARQFHRTELYQDVYRILGAEDQIAFALPGEAIVGIALNRSRRSFSDRDRALLEMLRPHLAQTYSQVSERATAWSLVRALEAGLEDLNGAVVMLDRGSRIAHASDGARELLAAYFSSSVRNDSRSLPSPVSMWLAQSNTYQDALRVHGARGELCLRRVAAPFSAGGWLVAIQERRAHPPTVLRLQQGFGLTRRQAEVLRLACTGKDNDAIRRELRITSATVRKHLEHVYTRMDVGSRTAAVVRAFGSAR